jgi:hypothetical protein
MNYIRQAAIVGALIVGAYAGPAGAHHSAAMYDEAKTVTVEGVVKEWEYANPHVHLFLIAKDAAGHPLEWTFEYGGASRLARAGVKRSTFKPGETLTIRTHPLRDGRPGGSLVEISRADGTPVKLR